MKIKAIQVGDDPKELTKLEKHWINELNVAFPYGLNDNINAKCIKNAYTDVMDKSVSKYTIYGTFNKIPSNRSLKGGKFRGKNHITKFDHFVDEEFDAHQFIMYNFLQPSPEDQPAYLKFIRKTIMGLKNPWVKLLFLEVTICISEKNEHFHLYSQCKYYEYLPYIIKDLCFHKLKSSVKPKIDNYNYLVLKYTNKYMDCINRNNTMKCSDISTLFPVDNDKMSHPTVTYQYPQTIRSSIVNYKQTIFDDADKMPRTCSCRNSVYSNYVDENAGHIFTGNLNIVENDKLRNPLRKGLNFREVPAPNKVLILKNIKSGLDSYVQKISNKMNTAVRCYTAWEVTILEKVKSKLETLNNYHYNNVLSQKNNKDDLLELQKKFVFVPTDKASNNVSIICKRYYLEVLAKELKSDNFEVVEDDKNTIIYKHVMLLKRWGLKAKDSMPFLY